MRRRGTATVRHAAVLTLVAALCVLIAPGSAFAATGVRVGHAPQLPSGTKLVAGVANVKSMQLTVALEPRNAVALARASSAVSSLGSADYHHYLSTSEFARRFGPTERTIRRVERVLREDGLHPGAVSENHLSISISGSSAVIDRAFSLTLARVRLSDGTTAVYNAQAPALPASIAGDVQAVAGMDGLAREQPSDIHQSDYRIASPTIRAHTATVHDTKHVVTGGPQPCAAARSAAPGNDAYTADEIASAYGFSALYRDGDEGQGVTIALYELEPNLTSDIAAFQKCYGTRASVSYIKVGKGAGNGQGGAGEGEAALDIEQVISYAPKAKILVYQGRNTASNSPGSGPYNTYREIIEQDRAQVISTSWGLCEQGEGSADATAEGTLFQEAAMQGETVVAASGDDGSEDCYDTAGDAEPYPDDTNLAVDDPGSQPYVTAAGGTTLPFGGSVSDQTIWDGGRAGCAGSPCAAGGGVSALWAMPSYQATAASWLNLIQPGVSNNAQRSTCGPLPNEPDNPYCRESPDVSADADPDTGYLTYYNGTGVAKPKSQFPVGWSGIGGTSAVAPLWAAIFALADAYKGCTSDLGFANPDLYRVASESPSAYAAYFTDVTSGENDMLGDWDGLYAAGVGYDMASGLGTPIVSSLVPALCANELKLNAPSAKGSWKGSKVNLKLSTKLPAGISGPVTYRAKGLPNGLKLNTTTGKITGRVKYYQSKNVVIFATAAAGAYVGAHFTWSVDAPPSLGNVSLTGAASSPALSFTVTAGKDEPAFKTFTIKLPSGLAATKHVSDVVALAAGGKALAHTTKVAGSTVTITMSASSKLVIVQLRAGSLIGASTLRADAERSVPATVRVAIVTQDDALAKAWFSPAVTPRP